MGAPRAPGSRPAAAAAIPTSSGRGPVPRRRRPAPAFPPRGPHKSCHMSRAGRPHAPPPFRLQAALSSLAPRAAAATQRLKPAVKPKAAPAKKAGTLKIGGDKKKAAPAPPPAGGTRKASGRWGEGGRARLQASLTPRPPPAQVTAISIFQKNAQFSSRDAGARSPPPPRVLARVQQLRLLSKLESAGILSALDRSGVTLSALEKSGALSIAESLGVLSRVADRGTPTLLYGAAAALFALGPAVAFLVPDDSTALIVAQAVVVAVAVAGGSAAFGGAALLSALQK